MERDKLIALYIYSPIDHMKLSSSAHYRKLEQKIIIAMYQKASKWAGKASWPSGTLVTQSPLTSISDERLVTNDCSHALIPFGPTVITIPAKDFGDGELEDTI